MRCLSRALKLHLTALVKLALPAPLSLPFGSSGKLGKAVPDRILGSVSPGREVGTIRVISICLHCPHGYREHTRETQTCAYHLNLKCALATAWLTAYWSEQA